MKLITRKELFEMKGRVLGHQVTKQGDGYSLEELTMMTDFRPEINDMSTMIVHPQYMFQSHDEIIVMSGQVSEDLLKMKGVSLPIHFGYWGRDGKFEPADTWYLIYEDHELRDFAEFILSAVQE